MQDTPAESVKPVKRQTKVAITEVDSSIKSEVATLVAIIRLKRIPKVLREIIGDYLEQHGREYVERNIRYANEKAKSSYSTYLQKSLKDDWGAVWDEEQQLKQLPLQQQELFDANEAIRAHEADVKRREEEKERRKEELEKAEAELKKMIAGLGDLIRETLKERAQKEMPKSASIHAVRFRYLQLVVESLGFPSDVINPKLAKDVWDL
jgi:hypothetical protein